MMVRACNRREVNIYLPKYGAIFLLLAVFVLIFIQHNMDFQKHEANSTIILPSFSSDPFMHHGFCTFQPLSSQDALEEDLILDSIAWPETPALTSLEQTSDPAHSSFTILPRRGGGQWHVGDRLEVLIRMYDFQGQPKKSGGDFLVARLHNLKLGAGVAGKVVDHLNGCYSAVFSLLWEGSAQVEVTLVHPSEAVTVLRRLTSEQPDRIYFQSVFHSGSVSETTTCNVCLRPTQQPLCNYTDRHTGEPWFCYKPKKLSCDARITHSKGGFKENLKAEEKKLFQSDVNMKVSIQASGSASVVVLPKKTELKKFNLHTLKQVGPFIALDYANNTLVTYRCHGPPIRFVDVPTSSLRYIANELDGLPGGSNTVVILGIWSHFSTFPIEVYIRRLQSIRRAVVRLLDRAPGTLVIIRTANLKALTLYEALTNSDWYSLQRDKVLRAVFKGLNVHLVDAWEMGLAHDLPHSLHPQRPIIENMIDVLLSYLCPEKGG